MSVADEWAWAHREEQPAPLVTGFEQVTAILVAHNGETWLPAALRALADLDHRPGRLIAVDAGSADASPHLLQEAMDKGVVARGKPVPDVISGLQITEASGYPLVVNQLIAALSIPQDGWLWLLHDDAAPSRQCLTELLRVATSPNAGAGPAIVVPKLLRPKLRHRPDQVLSVGETVSVSGARVVGAEVPQAERSGESAPTLGASTAGMLIRVDAWHALGGLSTELPGFRVGVDLGWRAGELGLAVKTAPEATLRHQQAGLLGLRDGSAAAPVEDHVAGLRVAIAHSRHPMLAAWRGRVVNRLLWVGAWLAKDDRQARQQSAILKRSRQEKAKTKALTKAVRGERKRSVDKSLLPGPFWGLKHMADTVMQRVPVAEDWGDGSINIDALTSDDDTVVLPTVPRRSLMGLGAGSGMVVATLIACRHLLGFAPLVSSGLAAAPSSLAGAWAAWLEPTMSRGANAPWLAIMAIGSTIAGGQPGLWASIMILGGVGLAAWSAYRFLKVFVSGWARVGFALLWAVILPATGASADGSPGWVLLGVALPFIGASLVRWLREPAGGLIGLRAPAALALSLVLAACVTPALWVAGVVAAVLVAVRVRDWRGIAVVVLAPLVVLGPWLLRVWPQPGRLLTGVDPTLSRLSPAPAPWSVPLGQLGLATTPWPVGVIVLGGLWLVGLIGIALVSSSLWRRVLLMCLAASVAVSAVMSRIVVVIDGQAVRAASLPWLLVAAMLSISVAAAGWRTAVPRRRRHSKDTYRRDGGVGVAQRVVAALAGVAALVGAVWWLWAGPGEPMKRQSASVPDYVIAAESPPRASRSLIVDIVDGQVGISLRGANEPSWGVGEQSPMPVEPPDRAAIVAIAGQFAEGFPSDDIADRLTALGIGYVVVIGGDDQATQAFMGLPKLAPGNVNGVTVWTVGGLPSRASLVDGAIVTPLPAGAVPAGGAGRVITLVERADLPWQVSVGGVAAPTKGSATRFEAPAAGGELRWWLPPMWGAMWWCLGAMALLVWAALPGSSGAKRAARSGARRAVS